MVQTRIWINEQQQQQQQQQNMFPRSFDCRQDVMKQIQLFQFLASVTPTFY